MAYVSCENTWCDNPGCQGDHWVPDLPVLIRVSGYLFFYDEQASDCRGQRAEIEEVREKRVKLSNEIIDVRTALDMRVATERAGGRV